MNSKVATKQTIKSISFSVPVGLAAGIIILLVGLISCGGSKPTAAPDALIKDYIAKHTTMVDTSLADLYVKDERGKVLQQVENNIADAKEKGTYKNLSVASFDFTGMTIKVLDATDDYVNDEIKDFLKVATSGSITMSYAQTTKTIPAESVLILEKVGSDWKITEKNNPWS